MSTNNQAFPGASRGAKRARFNEKKAGGASPWILVVGLAVVLALIGGTLFALTRPGPGAATAQAGASPLQLEIYPVAGQDPAVRAATAGHAPYPLAVAEDGAVRLPLALFDDYQAHFFTYMHEGRPIEFFVLKSQDGVVRAAFNACDVCFAAKKGYRQAGDTMVCNNCGNRFPSNQINEVRGGCNPSPLARTVDGHTLIIQVQDIVAGLGYF